MSVLVAPSTLMHASLAYLSPESKCFDSIIHQHSRRTLLVRSQSRTNLLSIPAELLLLIRSHLQLSLTSQFLARTSLAMNEYESAVRALLCSECCFYNEDVFGSSVWSWEGFSGPCSCDLIGKERSQDQAQKATKRPFLKQFVDQQHWVEAYLSREYRHLSPNPNSPTGIWSTVDEVLQEFGCMVVRDHSSARRLSRRQNMLVILRTLGCSSSWLCRPRHLSIVPLPSFGQCAKDGEPWKMELSLKSARRELGLDHAFEDETGIFTSEEHVVNVRRHIATYSQLDRKLVTFPCTPFRELAPTVLLRFFQTITACLTMPLAFVVTILCFYCKPGTLRLL